MHSVQRKNKNIAVFLLQTLAATGLYCSTSLADTYESPRIWKIPVFLSGELSSGYVNVPVSPGRSTPLAIRFGGGLSLGTMLWNHLIIAAETDFTFVNQYSEVTKSGGNFRGTRWNIVSPVLGYYFWDISIIAGYEFLGNYNFYSQSTTKNNISLTDLKGGRLGASYRIWNGIRAGILFQYLLFSNRNDSSDTDKTGVNIPLDPKFKMWQVSLATGYQF
ncbi:MAG: hypothetical protein A2583_10465 [Bdellovibrionales bacterium RIFOXYD1_FULL_53_11]|nr:MAG: hypothetical protein A2583_10465 [Bdellovibrionales bacterium RIFOXYD1_FULL_53_11]